jgi:hypothetical protein
MDADFTNGRPYESAAISGGRLSNGLESNFDLPVYRGGMRMRLEG